MAVNLAGGYELPFKIKMNGLAGRVKKATFSLYIATPSS
jgi:hypothetical protein